MSSVDSQRQQTQDRKSLMRRRYQRGTLFKRGTRTPVWVGQWREYAEDSAGQKLIKTRKEVLGPVSQMTRKQALRDLEERLRHVNIENTCNRKLITFAVFAQKWEDTVLPQYKLSTQRESRNVLRARLKPEFSSELMKEMTTERLQSWVSQLGTKPKTTRNIVAVLRGMWRSAKAWDYVSHDPFIGLMLPQVVKPETRCFTLDEVQRIIAAADEPHRTFYWLAAETGMRAGELCGLRAEDIDGAKGIVQVRRSAWRGKLQSPKSQAGSRACSISGELVIALRRHIDSAQSNALRLLFATREGNPWNGNKVNQKRLQPLLVRLGIPRGGLHAFRHFHATELDRNGVPLRSQIAQMGHSRATMTLRYGQAIDADVARFSATLGAQLLPTATKNNNGSVPFENEAVTTQ
jgi:integrase